MSQFDNINLTSALVQIARVNETAIATNEKNEQQLIEETEFSLVNKERFIVLAQNTPGIENPEHLWNVLLGNYSKDNKSHLNPQVQYLTEASVEQILLFWQKFQSGIDFQHLPKGFHLVANPSNQNGAVLHYSPSLKEAQKEAMPLAITLENTPPLPEEEMRVAAFSGAKKRCYELLLSKIDGYCSKKELDAAFRHFSQFIEDELKLSFDDLLLPNALAREPFNPIVLLGRWDSVMRNPQLKKEDSSLQWKMLAQLSLTTGHESIRAITDYFSDDNSCGFLLPEMELHEQKLDEKEGFRTILDFNKLGGHVIDFEKEDKLRNGQKKNNIQIFQDKLYLHVKENHLYFSIKSAPFIFQECRIPEESAHYQSIFKKVSTDSDNLRKGQSKHPLTEQEEASIYEHAKSLGIQPINTNIADFWRYIAYQPQRNSIEFYQKAIACINGMKIKKEFSMCRWAMYKVLAACTTQHSHQANSKEEEEKELEIWKKICSDIANFEDKMPHFMRTPGRLLGLLIEGKATSDYLLGSALPKIYPTLQLQQELLNADLNKIYNLTLEDVRNSETKILEIGTHRDHFLELLNTYLNGLYQGARFYRHQGVWRPLSIQDYVKLQYTLHESYPDVAQLIIPHVSTFNIQTSVELKFLAALKKEDGKLVHEKAIQVAMAYCQDVMNNTHPKLEPKNLSDLLHHLQSEAEFADAADTEMKVLNYLEQQFKPCFADGYFAEKRNILENKAFELTREEKRQLSQYQFRPEHMSHIEEIEMALKRKSSLVSQIRFAELNERFSKLRYILPENDFAMLLQNLVSLKEHFPEDHHLFIELLSQIQIKKSISGFTQLYQNLKDVPPKDGVIEKFVFFIKELKPFIAELKEKAELEFDTLIFEETLGLVLLHLPKEDLQQNLKEDLIQIMSILNHIAQTHAIAKPYLLSTMNAFLSSSAKLADIKQFTVDLQELKHVLDNVEDPNAPHPLELQRKSKENMLTFYSLLAHYHEKPIELRELLGNLKKLDPYPKSVATKVINSQQYFPITTAGTIPPNTVYLKKGPNKVTYTVYDESGKKIASRDFTEENCAFYNELAATLIPPSIQLRADDEAIFLNLIKIPEKDWFHSLFSKKEVLTLRPVTREALPQNRQPSSIYITFDTANQQFVYEIFDRHGAFKESGFINRAQLTSRVFEHLKTCFNPTITLDASLNEKVLAQTNELAKQQVEPVQKRFILKLISNLLGNKKSITGKEHLLEKLEQNNRLIIPLMQILAKPPYPDIETLNQWIENQELEKNYQEFSMSPYGQRELSYAFQKEYFHIQKNKYEKGIAELFSHELADSLDKLLSDNRKKPLAQLQKEVEKLRSSSTPLTLEQKKELLCLCIEMLARTTGQKHPEDKTRIISQELNTTQVMTLYAILATNKTKLISQIDTGEGKSRMAMQLAACEAIMGKTVDILTSDLHLSERDYLTYTPFFNALEIPTSLITINTPSNLYEKNGVNFTDDRQLLLLRNQSDVHGKPFAYLQENKQQRCLILDEEDVFRHDKSSDLYNYAQISTRLKKFTWIYPHLIKFMQKQLRDANNAQVHTLSLNTLVTSFMHHVQANESEALYKELQLLQTDRPTQISTWLYSAYQAIRMQEKRHYAATTTMFSVVDAQNKTRQTRKIKILDNGKAIEDATFAEGLHQCLCALKNQEAKDSFVITPENATLRSSLTTNFINLYQDGQLYGISGTTRSDAPRSSKEINHENYHYLIAPRHKSLQRHEKPIWLAKDEEQQIKFFKKAIIAELKAGNPILLMCKDDNQSQRLFDALTQDSQISALLKKKQRIHALSSAQEKNESIEAAGEEAVLTVSTVGNYGRGVDPHAENTHPLTVLTAYVPSLEDEIQIKGRTARNGKEGKYRMIPQLQDPDYPIKGNTHNVANEVRKLQGHMATQAAFLEETSKLYADFLEEITQHFLKGYNELKNANVEAQELLKLLENWSSFLGLMQKDWHQCRERLILAIKAEKQETFRDTFEQFITTWSKKVPSPTQVTLSSYNNRAATIFNATLSQQHFFKSHLKESIKLQHAYDPSDDGQARIYDVPFAQSRAILRGERPLLADFYAWREGRGDLFPDLWASLYGERPLFANLRAFISKCYHELKQLIFNQSEVVPVVGLN